MFYLLPHFFITVILLLRLYTFLLIKIIFQESTELTSSTRWRFLSFILFYDILISYCSWLMFKTQLIYFVIIFFLPLFFRTSLSKAIAIFENDERFKAVERDRDRKDMFDSFLEELIIKVDSTTSLFNHFIKLNTYFRLFHCFLFHIFTHICHCHAFALSLGRNFSLHVHVIVISMSDM